MLKHVLLIGALVASLVLAQGGSAAMQDGSGAGATQPVPVPDSGAGPVMQSAGPPDPAAPRPSAAQPYVAQPAITGTEVAQVVGAEFPSHDTDGDGILDAAEFSAWMVVLKTAGDPAAGAESVETKSWVGAAFVQADKDNSSSVTEAELTGFLSQGAS